MRTLGFHPLISLTLSSRPRDAVRERHLFHAFDAYDEGRLIKLRGQRTIWLSLDLEGQRCFGRVDRGQTVDDVFPQGVKQVHAATLGHGKSERHLWSVRLAPMNVHIELDAVVGNARNTWITEHHMHVIGARISPCVMEHGTEWLTTDWRFCRRRRSAVPPVPCHFVITKMSDHDSQRPATKRVPCHRDLDAATHRGTVRDDDNPIRFRAFGRNRVAASHWRSRRFVTDTTTRSCKQRGSRHEDRQRLPAFHAMPPTKAWALTPADCCPSDLLDALTVAMVATGSAAVSRRSDR